MSPEIDLPHIGDDYTHLLLAEATDRPASGNGIRSPFARIVREQHSLCTEPEGAGKRGGNQPPPPGQEQECQPCCSDDERDMVAPLHPGNGGYPLLPRGQERSARPEHVGYRAQRAEHAQEGKTRSVRLGKRPIHVTLVTVRVP